MHFEKIIRPHTDISLGNCSYLNTCRHMEYCKFIHYRLESVKFRFTLCQLFFLEQISRRKETVID